MATEPLVDGPYDYADSFEIRLQEPDGHTAEQWVRTGLEESPRLVHNLISFVHGRVARFDRGPEDASHVLGWRIQVSAPDVLHLQTRGPLLRADIVARRSSPTTARLTTFLFYRRRVTPLLWLAIGPLHRSIAPYLLKRAANKLTAAKARR